jgi:hypothetical protein
MPTINYMLERKNSDETVRNRRIVPMPNLPTPAIHTESLSNGIGDLRLAGRFAEAMNKYALKDWK